MSTDFVLKWYHESANIMTYKGYTDRIALTNAVNQWATEVLKQAMLLNNHG